MGWVNDAPAPVLEIVSGADVTTEVSVVGKLPDNEPGPAPGAGDAAGAVVELTTDVSSVGNRDGALPDGVGDPSAPAMADGSGFGGRPDSAVMFAFSNAACWSFTCCCSAFTVSVRDCTCWRSASTSAAVAGVVFEIVGVGEELAVGVVSCAETISTEKIANTIKMIAFIQRTPDSIDWAKSRPTTLRSAQLIQRREKRTEHRCPLEAGTINGSGVRRRRVREDVRAEKKRLDPNAFSDRSLSESNLRLRSDDERRLSSVLIAAGRDQCDCATVLDAI